jgi:hypothetical protein
MILIVCIVSNLKPLTEHSAKKSNQIHFNDFNCLIWVKLKTVFLNWTPCKGIKSKKDIIVCIGSIKTVKQ